MTLKEYNRKRNFDQTPEPAGKKAKNPGNLRFVVHMHQASRLHYDFRLEFGGSFKSWAVPKGPSLNPMDQRLAVYVEEHPLAYGSFEGIIPKGNYGAGTVMIWDEGTFQERGSQNRLESEKALAKGLIEGHITFVVSGKKLNGEFAFIKLKGKEEKAWLLVKKRDSSAARIDITKSDRSVHSGRTLEEITKQAPFKNEIWISGQGLKKENIKKSSPQATPLPKKTAQPSTSQANQENFPRRNRPMLATVGKEAFNQKGWIFEPLFGGTRAIAEIENGRNRLYSRQLLPFEKKFPRILEALAPIKRQLVLDGEIVMTPRGPIYFIYDILHLDGYNLRSLPLYKRKEKLKSLELFRSKEKTTSAAAEDQVIFLSPYETENGTAALKKALQDGWKGILAKDENAAYSMGTSPSWIKITDLGKNQASPDSTIGRGPIFTHLDKILWPTEKRTKGELVEYYRTVAPILLPHLKDYPQSLNRHPHGIGHPGFFQKDAIGYLPKWVETHSIYSASSEKSINYILCQNEWTLLYLINLGCIELNPWISRVGSLESPDYAIIDLDPDDNKFSEVVAVAIQVHKILESIGVESFCKTSGATGLHICIPCRGHHDYKTTREFSEIVCKIVHQSFPKNTSLERSPSKRRHKIYLDFMQNSRGQTLAAPYCVRPTTQPTVSTPLHWREVNSKLDPKNFTISNTLKRIDKKGDLWQPVLNTSIDLLQFKERLLNLLKK
jgi:DNA ligase D-like protein (predicted polymerase)/DNA ligase D-like protein (predicted 3'-phosphoesterase)